MDALDRIVGAGRDLLARSDAVLIAVGVLDEPELWSLLGRLGALPGDALDFVAALRTEPLTALSGDLTLKAQSYAVESAALAALPLAQAWHGSGSEAFTAQWSALVAHVGPASGSDGSSMAGRVAALASYVDALADWTVDSRAAMASTLAQVLTSAEAVELRSASGIGATSDDSITTPVTARAPAGAAVRVSVRVLGTVDEAVRAGHELSQEWTPRLGVLPYQPPAGTGYLAPGTGYLAPGTTVRVRR